MTQNIISRTGKILFTEQELKCKGSGILILAPGFADKLLEFREVWNKPMVVNSCCRSWQHNKNVGGNERSLHVADKPFWPTGGTCAIDISIKDASVRADFVALALHLNWSVGIQNTFVHMDRRIDYGIADKRVLFLY